MIMRKLVGILAAMLIAGGVSTQAAGKQDFEAAKAEYEQSSHDQAAQVTYVTKLAPTFPGPALVTLRDATVTLAFGEYGGTHSPAGRWLGFGLIAALALMQTSQASLIHHWSFNTDGADSVGGATATVQGAATITGGMLNLPGGGTFANYASVDIGNTLSNNPTLSVECWYTQNLPQNWSNAFGVAADSAPYAFLR